MTEGAGMTMEGQAHPKRFVSSRTEVGTLRKAQDTPQGFGLTRSPSTQ
ncbi:MAG: hypothetical protein GY847_38340 [Proteobacteria bacterium]|nr:hypothetical protein [Pseudomonadota bacterium]